MYELNKFVTGGLSQDDFERTRSFLTKYINLLTKTKRAELGYAIDSTFYGIPDYNSYIKGALAKLTREKVNEAIKRHLRADRVQIVAVSRNAEDLKKQLLAESSPPMPYNSPKPEEILAEDKMVQKWSLGLRPEDIAIVPVAKVFE
jgi:zinc protease